MYIVTHCKSTLEETSIAVEVIGHIIVLLWEYAPRNEITRTAHSDSSHKATVEFVCDALRETSH